MCICCRYEVSGQLNYCNVARDSVSEVVIIIRSSRCDKRENGETIGGFCDLLFRDILSALIINNNIECRIKIC